MLNFAFHIIYNSSRNVYYLERLWIWLTRLARCRGFGIQSPSAYSFVRYVVNEHYPYYAYADLTNTHPQLGKRSRKLGEFYFRLANFAQVSHWLCCGQASHWLAPYVQAGCKATEVCNIDASDFHADASPEQPLVVHLLDPLHAEETYERVLPMLNQRSILVVNDIRLSSHSRQLWQKLRHDPRTGVTFDLHYCGLVFFDTARPKQHYVINF